MNLVLVINIALTLYAKRVRSFVPGVALRISIHQKNRFIPTRNVISRTLAPSIFAMGLNGNDDKPDDPQMVDTTSIDFALNALDNTITTNDSDGLILNDESSKPADNDLPISERKSDIESVLFTGKFTELNFDEDGILDDLSEKEMDPLIPKPKNVVTGNSMDSILNNLALSDGTATEMGESADRLAFGSTDDFTRRALTEALAEVKKNAPDDPASDPSSILNDKEMMRELNEVFDKANTELVACIDEIKNEQDSLTKANAESMSKKAKQKEQKLEKAEENVSRLVNQFRDESKEVERAMALLKEVGLNEEPMSKLVDLKKAGLVKQGAVVGTLLFTLRSFGEFALFFSMDDSSRLLPAEIQGFIALACAALVAFS